MPFNLAKVYPELLEINQYSILERKSSLYTIFQRDIGDNNNFNFRKKLIRPFKEEIEGVAILFNHLTTKGIIEKDETGRKYKKRIFEYDRSVRLHWIAVHISETCKDNLEIFSLEERDQERKKDVIKTYVYNKLNKYLVVLEPHRSGLDYYMLSAHYLNEPGAEKSINKKMKRRLNEVY